MILSIFLQDFKTSFLAEDIYVYTPKGDVKMLPVGSARARLCIFYSYNNWRNNVSELK